MCQFLDEPQSEYRLLRGVMQNVNSDESFIKVLIVHDVVEIGSDFVIETRYIRNTKRLQTRAVGAIIDATAK